MPMGDVVMVKGEEEDHSIGQRAPVALQSFSQGTSGDSSDGGPMVLAVETYQEASMEGEEVEYGYPITCGNSRAVLLFKKFVCPGINVRCVKFNNQLISPKQFVQLAGKATLKDWKRAIRLGGVMLRKMMDSGQIDFYQHDSVCTSSCRSTKFDVLINSSRLTPSLVQMSCSPLPAVEQVSSVEDKREESCRTVVEPQITPNTANGEIRTDSDDASTADGSLSLWKGIAQMGLMGDVVSTIRSELLAVLRGVERRSQQASLLEADAAVLNTLTQMFGLLDSVRQVLILQQNKINTANEVLTKQLEKPKMNSRECRSTSVHPAQANWAEPRPPKQPRLGRPSSSRPLSSSPPSHFPPLPSSGGSTASGVTFHINAEEEKVSKPVVENGLGVTEQQADVCKRSEKANRKKRRQEKREKCWGDEIKI